MRSLDLHQPTQLDRLDRRVGIREINNAGTRDTGDSKVFPQWYTWLRGEQSLDKYKSRGVNVLELLGLDRNPTRQQVHSVKMEQIYSVWREHLELSRQSPRNSHLTHTVLLLNDTIFKRKDTEEDPK